MAPQIESGALRMMSKELEQRGFHVFQAAALGGIRKRFQERLDVDDQACGACYLGKKKSGTQK